MAVQGDGFYEAAFWLEGWFSAAAKDRAELAGPEEEAIFDALSRGWKAEPVGGVLSACAARFGKARVLAVIDRVVAANCRRDWAEVARREGKNGVEDLARALLAPLQTRPGWQLDLAWRDGSLQLHCTRCPFADLGRELEISEWVAHLVCGGDPHIVAGFNPAMGFRRTRMLTAGDDHCDHLYFMREGAAGTT